MHIRHFSGMVEPHPRLLRTPHIYQQDDPSAERGHGVEVQSTASSSLLEVHYVAAGPSSVCADGQGGEGKRRRFIGFGDEWSVDKDLRLVIRGVENGGLIKKQAILP